MCCLLLKLSSRFNVPNSEFTWNSCSEYLCCLLPEDPLKNRFYPILEYPIDVTHFLRGLFITILFCNICISSRLPENIYRTLLTYTVLFWIPVLFCHIHTQIFSDSHVTHWCVLWCSEYSGAYRTVTYTLWQYSWETHSLLQVKAVLWTWQINLTHTLLTGGVKFTRYSYIPLTLQINLRYTFHWANQFPTYPCP